MRQELDNVYTVVARFQCEMPLTKTKQNNNSKINKPQKRITCVEEMQAINRRRVFFLGLF